MKNILTWVGKIVKYTAGVLVWLFVFAFLQFKCIFSLNAFVDSLWLKDLHDGLVQNLTGDIAYRAQDGYGDYGCSDKYIYFVLYHPEKQSDEGEYRKLYSLVDVKTWKLDSQDGIITNFSDSKYRYTLRSISDGADMSAVKR